jgi:hypothetical protein
MATGGQVVSSAITVFANTPSMTMSPANGLPGTGFTVNFTGQFTHWGKSTLYVVGGQGVTLTNPVVGSFRQHGQLYADSCAERRTRDAQDHLHHGRRDRQYVLQRQFVSSHRRHPESSAAEHDFEC